MKDQCKMPDLVQRHDPRERGAIHQRLDRRRHDRVVIAENSDLGWDSIDRTNTASRA